jgi:hypothetical protein
VRADELAGVLNAHAFLRVERPPELWAPRAELEPFVRLLGELIAAALARNGGQLSEVTLNVANVVAEPAAAGAVPAGEFVAVTARGRGDWSPQVTWRPSADAQLVGPDLDAAAAAAGAVYGYSRVLAAGEGSVTVFFARGAG